MERKDYLDRIKGVAIIGVVITHVVADSWYILWDDGLGMTFDWDVILLILGLMKSAVPLFLMVSGVLLLEKTNWTISYLVYKIFKLAIILMIMIISYDVLRYKCGEIITDNLYMTIIYDICNANGVIHLWYLYCYIGIVLIAPILSIFVKNASKKQVLYFLVVCFGFNSFCKFLENVPHLAFIGNNLEEINNGWGVSSVYVGYFVLGYYLVHNIEKMNSKMWYVLGTLGIIGACILTYVDTAKQGGCMERMYAYWAPGVVVWSIACFIFLYKLLQNKKVKILSVLGQNTLGIYLIHPAIILVLKSYGYTVETFPLFLSVPTLTGIVMFGSLIMVRILKNIPLIKRLI